MPTQVAGEFTHAPQTGYSSRRMEGGTALASQAWWSMPVLDMAALSFRGQSTHRVQGLEFLPQVSHSTLLVWVCWVPGTFFLGLVL